MPIIVSKNGKNARKLEKTSFKEEVELQKYIYENPESIPLEEIKENVQFIVLDREFPISVGNIDALGVDSDGDIYIIETKLYKNPDKRHVVAQVLDYGASLWDSFDNPDEFVHRVDQRLLEKVDIGVREKLENSFGSCEELIDSIRQNISDGVFKFIILMDKVDQHLKSLIKFINQNSQFSVYVVELEYYTHQGYEILIPHLFGAEIKKTRRLPKKWDEESFFEEIERKLTEEQKDAVRKLYEYSKKKTDEITWGTGLRLGTFNPKFYSVSKKSVYTVWSNGRININLGWLNDSVETLEWREKLREELCKINQISKYIPDVSDNRWPGIPIEVWAPVVDDFIGVISNLIGGK